MRILTILLICILTLPILSACKSATNIKDDYCNSIDIRKREALRVLTDEIVTINCEA